MIPVWFNCGRGIWDTGLIERVISGKLWPLPVGFEVVPEPRTGGIAVVHGEVALAKPVPLPDGCVVIHGGDEARRWTPAGLRQSRVWSQHALPGQWTPDRMVVPACPPDTWDLLAALDKPRKPLSAREPWAFAGQIMNTSRREFYDVAYGMKGGSLLVSEGFSKGLERERYLRLLCQSAIIPSPAGAVDPEGFRLYEGIEAGCLPVAQRSLPGWAPVFDWWQWTLGEAAWFPVVDSWTEFPALVSRYAADPLALQRDANLAGAWWASYKRLYSLHLIDDVAAVGGERGRFPGLGSDVTILISSSPIPGHPSTDLLEETIRKTRAYPELVDCEIVIMLDGVSAEDAGRARDYEEYRRRVIELCNWSPAFRGCLPLVFEQHVHQAEMTRQALSLVRTPLVFFVEHDTYPIGEIDFTGIAAALLTTREADLIRLNIWHKILDEHRHLYPDGPNVHEVCGVPLVKTVDWSQRPHFARTDWYRKLLIDYAPMGCVKWIEHLMHGEATSAPWERFRMMVYAPAGDQTRSAHSDGRRWRVAA